MNRQEFLNRLGQRLSQLPQAEIDRAVTYYSEMIDDMMEDGYTELDAVSSLGSPEDAARQVLQDMPISALVKSRVKPKKDIGPLTVTLLILGSPIWLSLLIVFVSLIISVYAVIWSIILAFFAIVIAVGISSVVFLFSPLYPNHVSGISILSAVGIGFFGAGFTILLFHACMASTRALIRLSKLMIRFIKSLFIKEEGAK